ncbi:MAG: twin-arginine translocation signal domain-containing protein, partial [Alphaproteobacteria bacterium]
MTRTRRAGARRRDERCNAPDNMEETMTRFDRRGFLKTSAAASALVLAAPHVVRAAGYPERNIDVIIPTREGGGADRNFRAFTSIWRTKLGVDFEPGFFPGASGRVGYEVYMGKRKPDCYSLIFGNMGPEVLNWVM